MNQSYREKTPAEVVPITANQIMKSLIVAKLKTLIPLIVR